MEDLDADYFQWKEEQEAKDSGTDKHGNNKDHAKDLSEGIHKVWKTLTQRN